MLIMNHKAADEGRYIGLTEWLETNVGRESVDWQFIVDSARKNRLYGVRFKSQEAELLAKLVWSGDSQHV